MLNERIFLCLFQFVCKQISNIHIVRIADRQILLQNKENPLTVIKLDTPPLTNKHYIRFCSVHSDTNISTNSRTSKRLTYTLNNHADVFAGSYRRRTHFMDSCLRDYHLMLKAADAEMENAIKQMPLSKWE